MGFGRSEAAIEKKDPEIDPDEDRVLRFLPIQQSIGGDGHYVSIIGLN
jgi:hypothetical protein